MVLGLNGPIVDRVKVETYFLGLISETKILAFEVKVLLGLKSAHPDD